MRRVEIDRHAAIKQVVPREFQVCGVILSSRNPSRKLHVEPPIQKVVANILRTDTETGTWNHLAEAESDTLQLIRQGTIDEAVLNFGDAALEARGFLGMQFQCLR